MSAGENTDRRRGRQLFTVLFWVGVGLAPLAALLLLVGQGNGPLRIAAVLAVLAVVLIGLSITLRGDAESVRLEMEEALLEEIDELRGDLRNDIETAARATHRAFGQKLQILHDNVETLRAQVGAGVPAARAARAEVPGREHPGAGQAAVEGDGRHQRRAPGSEWGGAGRAPIGDHAGEANGGGPSSRSHLAGGVVRHTETVKVTTRQTIVGPSTDDSRRGNVYGGGGFNHDEHVDQGHHGGWRGEPYGGGRSGHGQDERYGQDQPMGGARWAAAPDPDTDPGDEAYWSNLRTGDREASVYVGERGREIRMSEREASIRADRGGTEVRMADRWAAVRQGEPHHDGLRAGGSPEGWDGPRTAGQRRDAAYEPASGYGQPRSASHRSGQELGEPYPESSARQGRRRRDDTYSDQGWR